MDPIHPINPQAPGIASVMPTTKAARVDRDGAQRGAGQGNKRRAGPSPPEDPGSVGDDDQDTGLHIDVSA